MRLGRIVAVTAALTAASIGDVTAGEYRVSFEVRNVDRSIAQDPVCHGDGATYKIAGQIVTPTEETTPRGAITIYVHSASVSGQRLWRFDAVPGYDWPAEMAKLGHASLVIDQLGWGQSDHPPGDKVCIGAEADILHQIVTQLRQGQYVVEGGVPIAYSHVALVGHSGANLIIQVEAYSWRDVDGLVVLGWTDPPVSTALAGILPGIAVTCALGGKPKNADGSGPTGYVSSWPTPEAEAHDVSYDADPEVLAALEDMIERDPCGAITSAPSALVADFLYLQTLNIPVLLVYGDHDAMAPPTTVPVQQLLYGDSAEVATAIMPTTGHMFMLERSAPILRTILSEWLDRHGLGD